MDSERAFDAEGPERAEVEARAELRVRGRARAGDFGVFGGVVDIAEIGEQREAARERVFAERVTGKSLECEPAVLANSPSATVGLVVK